MSSDHPACAPRVGGAVLRNTGETPLWGYVLERPVTPMTLMNSCKLPKAAKISIQAFTHLQTLYLSFLPSIDFITCIFIYSASAWAQDNLFDQKNPALGKAVSRVSKTDPQSQTWLLLQNRG